MNALLILPALLPLALAPFAHRLQSRWWFLSASLPALAVGLLFQEGSSLAIPWLLLGMHFMLDSTGRLFLLFGALIWMLAALFIPRSDRQPAAGGYRKQAFLLAMAGNALLILAADILTFYVGFALMGLSAYGLIWGASQRARRAARVYLVFTLIGELALFSALLFLMANSGSLLFAELPAGAMPPMALTLLLLGFGIKVALPGLHLWLPRAYQLAPVFGVAVLSGPMMKAGLLGWLRFLPLGTPLDQLWGNGLILLGSLGVLLGGVMGLMQREPRSVLAYSSIAKMGLFSALIGLTLNNPELAGLLIPAMVALALHHLLVKPMLFMGLDLWSRADSRPWLFPALTLLALSLAAVPLTGGGMAKYLLSSALEGQLSWLILCAGVVAVLLMGRFLWLLKQASSQAAVSRIPAMGWLLLLPVAVWTPVTWDANPFELKGLLHLALGMALLIIAMAVGHWFDLPLSRLRTSGRFCRFKADRIEMMTSEVRRLFRHRWYPFKQSWQAGTPDLSSQPIAALVEPVVWWLLVMTVLLGTFVL